MKNEKKINENASSGSTSSGGIASSPSGLHYSLLKRIPKNEFFKGYQIYKSKKDK